MPEFSPLEWTLAGMTVLILGLSLGLVRLARRLASLKKDQERQRQDSLNRSRAVLKGQISEHLAPLVPGFSHHLKDLRFMGQPVDYLVFSGLEGGRVDQVVFCEIKSGSARLSPVELSIKEAILQGRVGFETWRLEEGRMVRED